MDDRTLRVLEHEKIRGLLAEQASSSLGKARALELAPSTNRRWIARGLKDTTEARRLLEIRGTPPFGGLHDVRPLIARARIQGILAPEELLQIADFLRCCRRMKDYLADGEDDAPRLAELGAELSSHQEIESEIERCIDAEANVRRNASEALHQLTARADVLERRIRERMEAILRREAERGALQDPVIVQRNGRFCLPVQHGFQTRFSGLVHDRSDSGATVFMEPLEIVEIGNEMRQAYMEMEAEVERILRVITGQVGAAAGELEGNLRTLGVLDFILAKGRLAQKMGATEPWLVEETRLALRSARHPLIPGAVVPVDVWLGQEFSTLVITGPNTGGKTVTLKTVGLLALMTQCGLHIPAEPGSEMTVWDHVYADIGDEQSIEQSLSTFSSHMSQIVKIINRVQAHGRRATKDGEAPEPVRALVLLDEIGAGTDPSEGSALARSVLTELHEAGCRTIATTHYNDLKVYAYSTPGVHNASVEFDIKTLRPTYHLRIGHAGSSNAFDIAQRLGLARSIVRRGRAYLGEEEQSFEDAMSEVERQKRTLNERTREATSLQRDLDRLREQYGRDLEKLEAERKRALEEGFAEAQAIVRRAEERAREIIAELQRQPKQSRVTQEKREELQRERDRLERERQAALEPVAEAPQEGETAPAGLALVLLGDPVHVPALGRDGVVVGVPREGLAEVQVGNVRTEVRLTELEPAHEQAGTDSRSLAQRLETRKTYTVPRQLDIRGMTVDEAVQELEKYIDDVVLARFPEVRIVHGKGTGMLRKGVHDFLRRQKPIRSFRLAELNDGGEGATVVQF